MASVIQIKRRINGATGSPGATGAKEGELALNFPKVAGSTDKPELWAFDGVAYRQVNPDVVVNVGTATLPLTGTPAAGSSTGIGASWTALTNKPTGSITIATYNGTAYVKTGAGGADGDWTALGSATAFASVAELKAGVDTTKALNSAVLKSAALAAPSTTAADNPGQLIKLDTNGKINAGFLPITGLNFAGNLDLTITKGTQVASTVKAGDMFTVSTTGTLFADWAGVMATLTAGASVKQGDMLIYDGTKFHHIANAIDMSGYVARAGTSVMAADAKLNFATTPPLATAVILDGGANMPLIENVTLNCGTY